MAAKQSLVIYYQDIFSLIIFEEGDTFFVPMKIESDLRSFDKNNIIERASCKTQNKAITFQIWLSFCFYRKIACNCWKEVNSCINFIPIFRSFSMGQRNQKSYISQKIVDIVSLYAKEYR